VHRGADERGKMRGTHKTTVEACVPIPGLFFVDTHVVMIPHPFPSVVVDGSVEGRHTPLRYITGVRYTSCSWSGVTEKGGRIVGVEEQRLRLGWSRGLPFTSCSDSSRSGWTEMFSGSPSVGVVTRFDDLMFARKRCRNSLFRLTASKGRRCYR
jgi:hypothetical protein